MKVLYAASEALPFIASGGLGDVAGSLPHALRKRLIGCRVVDIDSGKEYGKVVDVLNYGSCDIYDTVSSGKHILIPATPDIVKEINTQYQIIKIKAMKGLFDEN